MSEKRKIYCFNNGGTPGWMDACALAEDGYFIAGHICSSEGFMLHDLGITSDWKHDNYNAHFGEGNWELIWVPTEQVKARSHPGLEAAHALHQTITEEQFEAHKKKFEAGIESAREARKNGHGAPSPPPEPSIAWRAIHNRVLVVAVNDLGVQWAAYVVPVTGINHGSEAFAWREEGAKLPEEAARPFFPELAHIEYRH